MRYQYSPRRFSASQILKNKPRLFQSRDKSKTNGSLGSCELYPWALILSPGGCNGAVLRWPAVALWASCRLFTFSCYFYWVRSHFLNGISTLECCEDYFTKKNLRLFIWHSLAARLNLHWMSQLLQYSLINSRDFLIHSDQVGMGDIYCIDFNGWITVSSFWHVEACGAWCWNSRELRSIFWGLW